MSKSQPSSPRRKRRSLFDYENKTLPLLSRRAYFRRIAAHGVLAILFILASLSIGMAGYHWIARLSWVDALLNASMILSGMGQVEALSTNAAKVFASFYALFSGIVLLASTGVLFAPIVHRFLHRFNIQMESEED